MLPLLPASHLLLLLLVLLLEQLLQRSVWDSCLHHLQQQPLLLQRQTYCC
jgi:hypothetical protein